LPTDVPLARLLPPQDNVAELTRAAAVEEALLEMQGEASTLVTAGDTHH